MTNYNKFNQLEREGKQEKLKAAISSFKVENQSLSDEIGDKDTARDLQERRKVQNHRNNLNTNLKLK